MAQTVFTKKFANPRTNFLEVLQLEKIRENWAKNEKIRFTNVSGLRHYELKTVKVGKDKIRYH
jgi:hypothetical protein